MRQFSFSIRSILFVMAVFCVELVGLRYPSRAAAQMSVAILIAATATAFWFWLVDRPKTSIWPLAFSVASVCLSFDLYVVPSNWRQAAFTFAHPADAAEHARSPATGLNLESVMFGHVFQDAAVLILAASIATLFTLWDPRSLSSRAVLAWAFLMGLSLIFIHEAGGFVTSTGNAALLTALICGNVLRGRKFDSWQAAFALFAICVLLFTHDRMLPTTWFYDRLHQGRLPPAELHQQQWIFGSVFRDCVSVWFGCIWATLVSALSGRKRLM